MPPPALCDGSKKRCYERFEGVVAKMHMFCVFQNYYVIINLILMAHGSFGSEQTYGNLYTAYDHELNVTQDGPVTLDVPITFSTQLLNAPENKQFVYNFKDDVDPPHNFQVNGNASISLPVVYPENIYKPGHYSMKVTCYMVVLEAFFVKVASKSVPFVISEYIPGQLDITGANERYGNLYSATGKVINMSISLQLPYHVFEQTEMSYSWTIGKDQFITALPYNNYQFLEAGSYNIHVAAVARIPVYSDEHGAAREIKYKWGYFNKEIDVKDPFNAINLTGNTYLKHGQLFNLEVSCNGSGPFEYCWKVFRVSEGLKNLTCLSPVVTTRCSFPIIYYFNPSGDYQVAIYIDNFVSSMQRRIDVHIYDVSLRPQLSTVIIPLFCSVLVIFIIAAGVMLHVRRNQQFDTEIADFDFLQSDPCIVETFWERLYHSIIRIFCRRLPRSYLCLKSGEGLSSPSQANYESSSP